MSALIQTKAPTIEPVDLAAVVDWEHLGGIETVKANEPTLPSLLAAARLAVEDILRCSMMAQEWKLVLDGFPCEIRLPRGPVATVDSIKYINNDGVQQTLASIHYQTDLLSDPPRIVPAYGEVWPSTRWQMNTVEVAYTAGVTDPANVSDGRKLLIKLYFATFYQNRETVLIDHTVVSVPHTDQLIAGNSNRLFEY